jgi:hypothetical protein
VSIRVFGVGAYALHQQREASGFDEFSLGSLVSCLLVGLLLQLLLGQVAECGQVSSLQCLKVKGILSHRSTIYLKVKGIYHTDQPSRVAL